MEWSMGMESNCIRGNENGEGRDELVIMNIICSLFRFFLTSFYMNQL